MGPRYIAPRAPCHCHWQALEVVELAAGPKALVITGEGKFFSNGLDVQYMMSHPEETGVMVESVWRLLARCTPFGRRRGRNPTTRTRRGGLRVRGLPHSKTLGAGVCPPCA